MRVVFGCVRFGCGDSGKANGRAILRRGGDARPEEPGDDMVSNDDGGLVKETRDALAGVRGMVDIDDEREGVETGE